MQLMKQYARSTFRPEVLTDIGTFGALFALGKYTAPVLVSSADGVGTKLKIAFAADRHDTVGQDLVNHCINDILTCGARPLFFLDYFATGKLKPEVAANVVKGLAQACQASNCALIGGETAEMPGFYAEGEYDIAGFIVGVVERGAIIDGKGIQAGDVALGLPSSGLHTNGYSLVRKVFGLGQGVSATDSRRVLNTHYPELGRPLVDELLEPHRCYLRPVEKVTGVVKGLAHITGGGLIENVPRMLPAGLAVRFDRGSWPVPPIFGIIQRIGNVDDAEMHRAFNMGVGMVLICAVEHVQRVQEQIPEARVIGEVVVQSSTERVRIEGYGEQ